jgi:hypothetical protein
MGQLQWLIATQKKIKKKRKKEKKENLEEDPPSKLPEVTIGRLLSLFLTTVAFFYPSLVLTRVKG